jgi:hypothetical protein
MEKHTRGLLADYAELLNRHGADSPEAAEFIDAHKANTELMELADLARHLKKALSAPAGNYVTGDDAGPTREGPEIQINSIDIATIATIAAELRRRLPEIEAELRRRQPEMQEAIRRLREAEVVTRKTLDLVIDI